MVIFMELFFEDLESWRRDAEINGKRYSTNSGEKSLKLSHVSESVQQHQIVLLFKPHEMECFKSLISLLKYRIATFLDNFHPLCFSSMMLFGMSKWHAEREMLLQKILGRLTGRPGRHE